MGAPLSPGQQDPDYRPRFQRTGGRFTLYPVSSQSYVLSVKPFDASLGGSRVQKLSWNASFSNPEFLTNAYFTQVLPQPDGRMWIEYAPALITYPQTPIRFVRLNPDGTRDESFALPVLTEDEDWRLLALLPDGKVLTGVTRPGAPLADRYKLLRLRVDGSIDPSFASAVAAGSYIRSAHVLPDGRVVAEFTPIPFEDSFVSAWIRLRPDGSRDETFNPPSEPNYTRGNFSAVSPDGEILIAGYGTDPILMTYSGGAMPLARLRTNGSLDPDFHPQVAPDQFIDFLPDGHLAIQMTIPTNAYPFSSTFIVELDHAGTTVRAIPLTPVNTPDRPVTVTRIPGSVYLVQDGYQYWRISLQGQSLAVNDITVTEAVKPPMPVVFADGSLFFGPGNPAYETVNGTALSGPVLLDPAGTIDARFTALTRDRSWTPLQGAGSKVLVYDYAAQVLSSVDRDGSLYVLGSRGAYFAPGSGEQLQVQSDGALVFRGSTNLQRILPNGQRVIPFSGWSSGPPRGLSVLPNDQVLVWGHAPAIAGFPSVDIGRLTPDLLRADSGFRATFSADTEVLMATPQSDGKVIVFCDLNRNRFPHLYQLSRLNADGSRDTGFRAGLMFDGPASVVRLDSQGRILVAGSFHGVAGQYRGEVVRLLPDGTPDAGFDAGAGPDAPVENLFVLPGDDVVLYGGFNRFNDGECWGLVKLQGGPVLSTAPMIASLTAPQSVRTGDGVSVGAMVTGEAPLYFQWFHNGVALEGETNAVLARRQVLGDQSGTYSLFVANGSGVDAGRTEVSVRPAAAEPASLTLLNKPADLPAKVNVGLVGDTTSRFRLQISTNLTVWLDVARPISANLLSSVNDPFGSQPGPRYVRAFPQ
ncbi:MAG TPA: hypothetical protein VMB21_17865 [Candidatus Limnocylindria bacterium]|jgi:uncharacterized delta-60 repeat protein|nr:hypothetical protein [Candidatus Limnocylindria bacterium]